MVEETEKLEKDNSFLLRLDYLREFKEAYSMVNLEFGDLHPRERFDLANDITKLIVITRMQGGEFR